MKHLKWFLFFLCVSLSLHLWADEKENINVVSPDMAICVNDNDSLAYGGYLMPIDRGFPLSLSLPVFSEAYKTDGKSLSLWSNDGQRPVSNDIKTYIVTVISEGNNGYVGCSNSQVRNGEKTFIIEEGDNFSITAIPDEGYRVKYIRYQQTGFISYTTDYTDRETTNHSKTLQNIKGDVVFTVEFEKIPDVFATYTITVTTVGDNGYVSCANDQVRNGEKIFNVEEGSNFSITAIPDEGYRVKYIRYQLTGFISNTTDYTDRETTNHSKTLQNIKRDVVFIVEFEKIPDVFAIYTITVTTVGDNGYVSCANDQVRNGEKIFNVEEGSTFSITAIPDEGYRVKYIRYQQTGYISNTTDYTDRETTSRSKTLYNIKKDVVFTVEFEKIYEVNTMYAVTLVSNTEHGYTNYLGDNVRNTANTYSVDEGSDFSITAIPDEGYRVKSIIRRIQNSNEEIWNYSDNTSKEQEFTSYSISKDQTIEVNFERIPGEVDDEIYLSIFQTENDCTKLQVEKGERVKLQIKAAGNWRVQSISYNGMDVTSELVDGYYTTPEIYQNAELHIVYGTYYK